MWIYDLIRAKILEQKKNCEWRKEVLAFFSDLPANQNNMYDGIYVDNELIYKLNRIYNKKSYNDWRAHSLIKRNMDAIYKEIDIRKIDAVCNIKEPEAQNFKNYQAYAKWVAEDKENFPDYNEEAFEENLQFARKRLYVTDEKGEKRIVIYKQLWNKKLVLSNTDGTHHFALVLYYCLKHNKSFNVPIIQYTKSVDIDRLSKWLGEYYIFSLCENKISMEDRHYLSPIHTGEPGIVLVRKNQTDFLKVLKKLPEIVCPLNELIKKKYLIAP